MQLIQRIIAVLMNRVRVNHVHESVRDGTSVFVKHRRTGARAVIGLANVFLALARSGIRMCGSADEWIRWEVHCARLLYPDRPVVCAGSRGGVVIPKVAGVSLRQVLDRNEADVTTAFTLAARELRRVHQIPCRHYNGRWSHGDLHLDNIIYDRLAGRAVLIDFDTRHEFRTEEVQRHGDDLKVVLLELIARSGESWDRTAAAFLQEYGDRRVLSELVRQLFVPGGFARLLWYARTNGAPIHRIEPRLEILRRRIHQVSTAMGPSS